MATALGYPDADELMRAVSTAARSIAWTSDEVWERVDSSLSGPRGWRMSRDQVARPRGGAARGPRVPHRGGRRRPADPLLLLRVAAAAAEADRRIDRHTLDRLAADRPRPADSLVRRGPRAVRPAAAGRADPPSRSIETLDQRDLFVRILPEWAPVRCKPQRNAYHRFTVDRHLCETAANASALVDRVARPDLLVIGALLHDIGKGYPGDHTEVGIGVVRSIGERMGFAVDDITVLQDMVRHHLLLPEVATRRDLSDEGTIRFVADRVSTLAMLRLLGALAEADSLATGPAAWSTWKAELLAELASRVAHLLGGAGPGHGRGRDLPDPRAARSVGRGPAHHRGPRRPAPGDRPRPARPVLPGGGRARAQRARRARPPPPAPIEGMALETYRVESNFGPVIPWDRVIADVEKALDGRLALDARLRERAHVYANRSRDRRAQRADGHLRQRPVRRGHRRRGPRPRRGRRAVPHHPGHRRSRPRHPLGQGADDRPRRGRRLLRAGPRRPQGHRRRLPARAGAVDPRCRSVAPRPRELGPRRVTGSGPRAGGRVE